MNFGSDAESDSRLVDAYSSENNPDNNLRKIEAELSKYHQNLNDKVSFDSLVELLDKFQSGERFNRVLFFHVIEYNRLDKKTDLTL